MVWVLGVKGSIQCPDLGRSVAKMGAIDILGEEALSA